MRTEYCKTGNVEDHNYLVPRCQANINQYHPVCNEPEYYWEHNTDYPKGHPFVAPEGELIWGDNALRMNDCYKELSQFDIYADEYCDCNCHWNQYYVNVYEIDRGYGGPEEGGWWYDIGNPVLSVPFDLLKEAKEYQETLLVKYPRTGKSSSVIYSGGDYQVMIERYFAEAYPKETPHYE